VLGAIYRYTSFGLATRAASGKAIAAIPSADGLEDDIRRAVVGILAEYEQGDPTARAYRMKLSSALY